jgi:hypothetical protein
MGTSIVYQARSLFPTYSTTSILNAKPVIKDGLVLNSWLYSDITQNNYRYLKFTAGSGENFDLLINGYTIFNQPINEILTLNGNVTVTSANMYKSFQVRPVDDSQTLSIGAGDGMTEIIAYDGAPTSHRVIVNGSGEVKYSIYGLLTLNTLTKAQLDAQKFIVNDNLKDETTTTPSYVLVNQPASKLFMEVIDLEAGVSLDWQFNTQSLL